MANQQTKKQAHFSLASRKSNTKPSHETETYLYSVRLENLSRQIVSLGAGQIVMLHHNRTETSSANAHREMTDMVYQMVHYLENGKSNDKETAQNN